MRPTATALALAAAAAALGGCGPRPAHVRPLGDAPAAVAWGAGGAWIAVTHGRGARLRLLSPDLHSHVLETPWPADPGDGSVRFGESVAASADAADPLFAAGAFFPSYLGDGGEARITVWSVTGRALRELRAPAVVALGRLTFLPGRRLAALVHVPVPGRPSDRHGALYVWDVVTGDGPHAWLFPRVGAVRDVDLDAAGRRVALLAADGPYVADVDATGASPPRPLSLGARAGSAIALGPDGALLAAAREDGVSLFGGPGAPRPIAASRSTPAAPGALRFAPSGAPRLALLAAGGRLRVIDLGSGRARTVATRARAFAWSPDGRSLAVLSGHGRLAVFDAP